MFLCGPRRDTRARSSDRNGARPLGIQRDRTWFLLNEDEFLGVQQGPEDVLIGNFLVLGVAVDVSQRGVELLRVGPVRPGAEEQFLDLVGIGTWIFRQLIGAAAGAGEFALDFIGIQ